MNLIKFPKHQMDTIIPSAPHFKGYEIGCKCGDPHINIIYEEVLIGLEQLREIVGLPITINSGFRCRDYNATIPNSAKDSPHCYGIAVDLKISGYKLEDYKKLILWAFSFGFRGIGIDKYKGSRIHLDFRRKNLYPNIGSLGISYW